MVPTQPQSYTILSTLGSGCFCTVFLASSPSGELVAIKQPSYNSLKHVACERALLTHLHEKKTFPGVPRLLDTVFLNDGLECLVLEYIAGQSIATMNRSPKISVIIRCITEFLSIMARLHAEGIEHNDLRDDNILLDAKEHIHIIDFGMAYHITVPPGINDFQEDIMDIIYFAKSWILDSEEGENSLRNTLLAWFEEIRAKRYRGERIESAMTFYALWQEFCATSLFPLQLEMGDKDEHIVVKECTSSVYREEYGQAQ